MPDVLIVDDDSGFTETCALTLGHEGYVPQTAGSVHAAMAVLDRCRPDAMLLDWKLPDGTALDILESAAGGHRPFPTALVTGFWIDPEFQEALARARALGVRLCVRRGLDFDEPGEIVRRLLDPLWPLHKALLAGSPLAAEALARELPLLVQSQLRTWVRFRCADHEVIDGAVLDATSTYLTAPCRFDPVRHVSVQRFTAILARRILWNALRSDRRRHLREQEYARRQEIKAETYSDQASHGQMVIDLALTMENDLRARAAIRAWLDGQRDIDPWLAIPAIRDLPAYERGVAIQRRKDAFRVRVKRLAKRSVSRS